MLEKAPDCEGQEADVGVDYAAVEPFELREAGDEAHIHRAARGAAREPGVAGAHPFDWAKPGRDLFDIDAWGSIFGHRFLLQAPGRTMVATVVSSFSVTVRSDETKP